MRMILRLGVLLACLVTAASMTLSLTAADASTPATRRVVVRPVTTAGVPVAGWTVHRESVGAGCWGGSASARDDGIAICGPSALYLPSCWQAAAGGLLCLRDATQQSLVHVRLRGTYPVVAAPARPSPQDLVLANGDVCQIRVGGAWGSAPGHPHWVGFYSCRSGDVYGPPHGDGVDRSHPVWRVRMVTRAGRLISRAVTTAEYVGTAA